MQSASMSEDILASSQLTLVKLNIWTALSRDQSRYREPRDPAWAEEQLHACLTSFRKKECLLVLNLYNFSIEYRFLISFSQLCSIRRDDQN